MTENSEGENALIFNKVQTKEKVFGTTLLIVPKKFPPIPQFLWILQYCSSTK